MYTNYITFVFLKITHDYEKHINFEFQYIFIVFGNIQITIIKLIMLLIMFFYISLPTINPHTTHVRE